MATRRTHLARARKAAGYTQEGFAEALHVHRTTVVRWETGGGEPLPYLRPKVASLLKVAPDQLEALLANGLEQSSPSTHEPDVPAGLTPPADEAERAWQQLVRQANASIELDLQISFDIADDGRATLTGRHELLNLSDRPVARLARELWFEHTDGPLRIRPLHEDGHRVAIQRVHDTDHLAKFACLVSPAIQPGESAVVGYTCDGGSFVSDHYWQQTASRYIRQLSIRLRHRGARQLVSCTAVEEHPDGAQNSATEALEWDEQDGDVVLTLRRRLLLPNQIITLRWDVDRGRA
ncbi:helix-turn-helix transcriptional regulator [Actinosynnema sp. NPDC051121]